MRIGYSTWSMKATPYQVFLPRLQEIGYTAIALDVSAGGGRGAGGGSKASALGRGLSRLAGWGREVPNDLARLTADDRRRIKTECQERGIEIDAVMGHTDMLSRDPEQARANMERLKRTIDFCVEVAPQGQRPPAMTSTAGRRPHSYAEDRALIIERAGELAEYARSRGVVFGLEVHANTAVSTPDRVDEVLGAINGPHCRLDFDGSHFEVQLIPMEQVIPQVLPWTVVVDIKDQRVRYADEPAPEGWRIPGNGIDRTQTLDGRAVEWQWVVGGEGDFQLPKFLRLMQQQGWDRRGLLLGPSIQVQRRPDFDALAAARRRTAGWRPGGRRPASPPPDPWPG